MRDNWIAGIIATLVGCTLAVILEACGFKADVRWTDACWFASGWLTSYTFRLMRRKEPGGA